VTTTGEPQVETPPATERDDAASDTAALLRLSASIAEGNHWCLALLEAVALWRSAQEEFRGRHYTYLINGEAFDWLELADRLLEELGDTVPADEREALLFQGRLPVDIGPWEFQRLLGRSKYRAHLNFWYGVLVEEALLLAVEERFAKEHAGVGPHTRARRDAAVYEWVYGATLPQLLAQFWEEQQTPATGSMSLTDLRKFTYWCFKYRVTHRDPAKVASDTRLGVDKLQQMYARQGRRPPVL
jgi:hypothetical protein